MIRIITNTNIQGRQLSYCFGWGVGDSWLKKEGNVSVPRVCSDLGETHIYVCSLGLREKKNVKNDIMKRCEMNFVQKHCLHISSFAGNSVHL